MGKARLRHCPAVDIIGFQDMSMLSVSDSGTRNILDGLPCIACHEMAFVLCSLIFVVCMLCCWSFHNHLSGSASPVCMFYMAGFWWQNLSLTCLKSKMRVDHSNPLCVLSCELHLLLSYIHNWLKLGPFDPSGSLKWGGYVLWFGMMSFYLNQWE